MSRRSAKHRKPPPAPARPRTSARHRKPSPIASALQQTPTQMAVAVAGAALVCAAAVPAVAAWPGSGSGSGHGSGDFGQAASLRDPHARPSVAGQVSQPADGPARTTLASSQPPKVPATRRATGSPAPAHHHRAHHHAARRPVVPVYRDPLRAVSGLIPERVDQGVDFGGSGPIYALGNAVITQVCGDCYGWPGGGWITYRLTDGPAAGLVVFVAEDVRPTVAAGAQVTSSTVIASMFNGGDGIETGWAMADSFSAESQLPEAGGISGAGPFPTVVGMNFEELLQALGVPAANNRDQGSYGVLPPSYPADWATALDPRA